MEDIEDFNIYLDTAKSIEERKSSLEAQDVEYYWLVSKWARVAIGHWAKADDEKCSEYGTKCVSAVLDYFYGEWRERLETPNGDRGHEAWKPYCL